MSLDIVTKGGVIREAKGSIAQCPYCGRALTDAQRLTYPPAAVGAFATVYRCGCGKHIGAPVRRD